MIESSQNWKKTLLKPSDTMQDAIDILAVGGLRIALVIDAKERLLGTITDGDVRRALIRNSSLIVSVDGIMNSNPMTASDKDDEQHIQKILLENDILQVPVINSEGRVVGLKTFKNLIKASDKIDSPVLLMAGGFGKRLRPLTNHLPKPLLQISSKPILETIFLQFVESGFNDFYISTYYKKEEIQKHFGDGSKWGVSIQYIHEDKPLGTAGALGLLPKNLIELPLIVMNGDLLTKINFQQLLSFHKKQGGIATICARNYDFQIPYGVIESHEEAVQSIREKPTFSYFVNAGIYVLESALVKPLPANVPLNMPDLLQQQIKNNKKISIFPIHEYWIDIGRMEEYERAEIEYSLIKDD